MGYQDKHDRASEYTKWAASRPGVPHRPSENRHLRNPLQRPVLTLVGILAFVIVLGGGAYAMFGAGGPVVSADHNAVVDTIDLDATICCITHQEIDNTTYLFVPVLESGGFLSEQRDLSLRIIALDNGPLNEVSSLEAPISSTLPQSMAVAGSTAYVPLGGVTDDEEGIWILDISAPANPEEIGLWSSGETITSLQELDEDRLIAHASGVFQFLDISQRHEPEIFAEFRQPVSAVQRMDMQRDRLYYRETTTDRIVIADAADVTTMRPLGRHLNVDRVTRTPVRHSSVVASAEERLEITAPSRHYQDFAVRDDILYVAASDLGVEIVDVSDPTDPDTINRIQTDGRAVRTAVAGDVLYAVTVDEESRERLAYEVHAFDLADPVNPELLSTVDDIRAAPGRQAIETSGGRLFLGLNDTVVMIDRES
jgi:hypothetical protein